MLKIKKYANGRFFDTVNKKYVKPDHLAEMIKKGEKVKVTLTKTGKDITESVIEQFSKKEKSKKAKQDVRKSKSKKDLPLLKTDKLVKWIGEVIDTRINKMLDIIKLPSRDQVAELDKNIKALNKKIDNLQIMAVPAAKKPGPKKTKKEETGEPKNRVTEKV